MVGTLFLMIFFFKTHEQIETVHVCNRAICFRHYMKFPAILVQVHFHLDCVVTTFICIIVTNDTSDAAFTHPKYFTHKSFR